MHTINSRAFQAAAAVALVASFALSASPAFAAIAFGSVATTSTVGSAGPTLVISKPSSTASGDFLIAGIQYQGGTGETITAPSGWTLIERTDNGTSFGLATYYKVAGASEGSSYTWTFSPDSRALGGIIRYTGVDTSSPVDVHAGATGTSATPTGPSVTTTQANDLVVGFFSDGASSGQTAENFTAPGGMTERYDITRDTLGGVELSISAADVAQAAAGASGTKAATTGSSDAWAAQTIALKQQSADTTGPVFSGVPSDFWVEATSPAGATVTYTSPTANDAVDGARPVSCILASGSTFPVGTTTVTCTTSDLSSNTSTATFDVGVVDTTAPTVIVSPSSQTVEATSASGATATFGSSAADLVSGSLSTSCDATSGVTVFPLDTTTTITCTATDAAGNIGTGIATVTVQDTTPPSVSVTGANPMALGTGDTYTEPGATASDLVDGSISATPSGSVNTAVPGSYTITYTATDAHGNTGTNTRTVNVSDDDAPVITTPGNQTAEATGSSGAVVTYTEPTAVDNVSSPVTPSCDHSSGETFPVGVTTVSCSASDAIPNTAYASFTVTVQDTTPPTVSVAPATQTLEATGAGGAAASFTVSASDIVDGDLSGSVSCDATSGQTFALGTTTITCSVSDVAANTGTGTGEVVVVDTTAPVITRNGGAAIDHLLSAPYTDEGATASDIVDGSVPVTQGGASIDANSLAGTYVITYDAVDSAGNAATQVTRTVTVKSINEFKTTSSSGASGNGPIVGTVGTVGAVLGAFTSNLPGGQVLGASAVGATTTTPGGGETTPAECSALITEVPMAQGLSNDPAQVNALQGFLNTEVGANLPVSGVFGPLTTEAVKTFQLKYWQEVLAPWVPFGLPTDHTATGLVGKTTAWKINMIFCPSLNLPMPQIP